jgi:hypothetical protein
VFELETIRLGEDLTYRPDPERPDRHGFVEPRERMAFGEYQAALAATLPDWREMT